MLFRSFANTNDPTITVTTAGTYMIVATAGNDIISSNAIQIVEQSCVGVQELMNENIISFYPNPASERLIINTANPVKRFIITDLTGKVIREIENNINHNEIMVSLEEIDAGIYFIMNAERTSIRPFVVVK